MKAAIFHEHGGPEKISFEDVPDPKLERGEVLIRVKACSLNHLDIWVRQGIPAYKIRLPHISGCDVSGEVAGLGDEVKGIKTGTRVIVAPGLSCFQCEYCLSGNDNLCQSYTILGAGVDGGYAQFVKAPFQNVIGISDSLSFEEAAAFPLTFLTAWHMLMTRCCLKAGQVVLVLAAGSGIGSAAIQIAKLAGARVIAAAGTEEKCERAKKLGADEIILYSKEDFSKKARVLTHGQGVDVVFEHVGRETWEKSVTALRKNGKLVTCGATTGNEVKLDLRYVFSRQLSILGSMMGCRSELLTLVRLMGEKKLKAVIDQIFPLAEARRAQERMLERKNFGKILLIPE
ncbi:MAG: zinc-binding dehydrogenase [Chlamydiae bacterium]|nr:zinc-binding dehydrogenase [Chlamydiota bacterium]MBI3277418.1 zinc-binding dehydrogenase [Chlamydiota bacterium]